MKRKPSKVSLALDYMAKNHCSAYEAAKAVGASFSPVYARVKRDRAKSEGKCPRCGQTIPTGGDQPA
jgi:hypothetical protein